MIDDAVATLGEARFDGFADDLGQARGFALDRAVRKRTFLICGFSPGASGSRSSSTTISVPPRSTTGRGAAK